jgi:hypothetical protein
MINFHACSAENLKKGVSLVTSMFCPFLNGSLKMARGLDAKKKKKKNQGESAQRGISKGSEAHTSRWVNTESGLERKRAGTKG